MSYNHIGSLCAWVMESSVYGICVFELTFSYSLSVWRRLVSSSAEIGLAAYLPQDQPCKVSFQFQFQFNLTYVHVLNSVSCPCEVLTLQGALIFT